MEEAVATRYWCHLCSQMVNPIMEAEIKCPFCSSGFVEEMSSNSARDVEFPSSNFDSDRALSLWAPILLGMMGNTRRRRRLRRAHFDFDDDSDDVEAHRHGDDSELDREIEFLIRRRRRSSAAILQLLEGIRSGIASESGNYEGERDRDRDRDRGMERDRGRVLLVSPFDEAIVVQGSYDGHNQNQTPIGSLGDYFLGPGLDMLLQHLAENDPNRYGTPPAQKEAIDALPTVTIKEALQCSVCLDDFEVGTEAKEMPCKHKFHSGCLLPWLELHSSCPVCRFQLPSDESKLDSETSSLITSTQTERESHGSQESHSSRASSSSVGEAGEEAREGNARRFSFPWPFNSLFSSSSSSSSSSGSQSSGSNSSAARSNSQTDEN